jgi:hypothetical protein
VSEDNTFSESGPGFDPGRLTPEQKRTYDAAQRSLDKEFAPDKETADIMGYNGVKAGYKIEIMFGPKRTPQGPNNIAIQIWESGKRLDGDADDRMYWCRDVRQNSTLGCGKPIPSGAIHDLVAICPSCQMAIRADKLTGEQFHRITTQNLALKLEALFHDLKDNADIYCKYDQSDIRYQACLREKGFEKARYLRGLFIYPLKNILKDTAAGATLATRFKAFLSA